MDHATPIPIAIVGNVNLDVKTAPIAPDPRLLLDGETSVAEVYETLGGGGANTAIAAARMGCRVTFCGAVGDDALGERLAAFLARHGVHPLLARKPGVPTGRSIALNWQNHQRHFLSCLPSALLLDAADVDVAALAAAGCRHLYRADIWFAPHLLDADDNNDAGNARLLREAREHGLQTSIDLNWDPHWHAGRGAPLVRARIDAAARMLPHATYVHGNERELCFFAARPALPDAAAWFFDRGARCLIVHLGPAGSAAMTADGAVIRAPAEPVARIVSEAGTGDVFTAAFLLRHEMELPQRLVECNAVAALHLSGREPFLPRLDAEPFGTTTSGG
jgi:sugar/nucleoside kinase (ribokinase family)